jgi:hypothetical protein
VARVLAREEIAPCRRTHRRAPEHVPEYHALSGHAVKIRRLDVLSAHEGRLVVTEFIGHDVNDVRFRSGVSQRAEKEE